jgi:hypothetical protein
MQELATGLTFEWFFMAGIIVFFTNWISGWTESTPGKIGWFIMALYLLSLELIGTTKVLHNMMVIVYLTILYTHVDVFRRFKRYYRGVKTTFQYCLPTKKSRFVVSEEERAWAEDKHKKNLELKDKENEIYKSKLDYIKSLHKKLSKF